MCNLSPNKYAMVLQVNNNEQPNKQKQIKQNIQIKWQKKCLLSSEDEGVREVQRFTKVAIEKKNI